MSAFAPWLVTGSAAIVLAIGLLHLLYTFRGPKLWPRDAELRARMAAVSPVITRETTMWRAWLGFNATHSLGAILFGVVYGYLALRHADFLFASTFLLAVGLLMLVAYAVLARRYFFGVPFRCILLSLVLYLLALVAAAA